MQKLIRSLNYLISAPAAIAAVGLVILLLLVVGDVFLRHTIKAAIPGGIAFSRIILAIMVFFALGQAQANKEHIRVELFINKLLPSKTLRRYWDLIIYVVAIIFFAIIFWESIDSFKNSYEIKEYYGGAQIRVPIYPARGALLVGCVLIIGQLIKDSIQIFTRRNKV